MKSGCQRCFYLPAMRIKKRTGEFLRDLSPAIHGSMSEKKGRIYLIGAEPGDVGLLTLHHSTNPPEASMVSGFQAFSYRKSLEPHTRASAGTLQNQFFNNFSAAGKIPPSVVFPREPGCPFPVSVRNCPDEASEYIAKRHPQSMAFQIRVCFDKWERTHHAFPPVK